MIDQIPNRKRWATITASACDGLAAAGAGAGRRASIPRDDPAELDAQRRGARVARTERVARQRGLEQRRDRVADRRGRGGEGVAAVGAATDGAQHAGRSRRR